MEHNGASNVVQNNVERGEDTIQEGKKTTVAKYTDQCKIIQLEPQQRRGRITMEARCRCGIFGMVDKFSGEDSSGRAR